MRQAPPKIKLKLEGLLQHLKKPRATAQDAIFDAQGFTSGILLIVFAVTAETAEFPPRINKGLSHLNFLGKTGHFCVEMENSFNHIRIRYSKYSRRHYVCTFVGVTGVTFTFRTSLCSFCLVIDLSFLHRPSFFSGIS